ncbi:MAG: formyltransferase family protein [Bacteroidia bacterium]|nr:formyltransferase family protein [Bacteroidia bacterium]
MKFEKLIDPESLWGEFYKPVRPKENFGDGLRVVLFVSCNCGNNLLVNLFRFEQKYPGQLNIVGVVTDDPMDPNAKISLKKRIWSQYTPEERSALREKIINSCMNIGIPCYTGAVKTDYFRRIYESWNPEVLIMFCFGQKLDSFLYDFPAMGAYNLHPSDLPKQIGAGTQPFQNAIRNGLKTSPLVIHRIAELIDMGPIVGVSTPINIRLEDGTSPQSLLTLLEKITSLGGWMTVQLISDIIKQKARSETGPLSWIDFNKELPEEIKQLLMMPATNDLTEMYEVPLHPLLMK